MKNFLEKIRRFFFPPSDAPTIDRVMPYAVLGVVTFIFLTAGAYGWEYTNSPVFCGQTCHTMPPEYAAYQVSPHARVPCVDCHIGQGFIAKRITRKAGDISHVVKMTFRQYEFPIRAGELRPARETCELCHYPAKFSDDSLREIISFMDDEDNTQQSIYLALRTGGGTQREGLGRGIHWHVENQVLYAATDELEQDIPYVKVISATGEESEYVSVESGMSAEDFSDAELERMDCMSCHNRISHNIRPPEETVDLAIARRQISREIPFIRMKAVEVLSEEYTSQEEAHRAIEEVLYYYRNEHRNFYAENQELVSDAVDTLHAIYDDTVFIDQEVDWQTHPNNIGHKDWPGCFRCHDGQHASESGEIIRLECNLCHSIPEVVGPGVLEPELPLATGIQPESHFRTDWIHQHRAVFNTSCQACHTVEDPGGTSNTSFCSNSACHGTAWEHARLDAPGLADVLPPLEVEIVEEPESTPEPEATEEPMEEEAAEEPAEDEEAVLSPTWRDDIAPLFEAQCVGCHSQALATGGLVLDTYNAAMTGTPDGPVILPGDAESSLLVEIQRAGHFATFDDDDLDLVILWIREGAAQN